MPMIEQGYRLLLRLYPAGVRGFAPEMSTVFESAAEEQRCHGRFAFTALVCRELFGLLRGAAAEWMARLVEAALRRPVADHLDLTRMRPPNVSRQVYAAAIDEVLEARRQVDFNLRCMAESLSRQDFVRARFYSDEERGARDHWRSVQRKYHIPE